jgi:hypothetical protein
MAILAVIGHRAGTYQLLECATTQSINIQLEPIDKVAKLIEQIPAVSVFPNVQTLQHLSSFTRFEKSLSDKPVSHRAVDPTSLSGSLAGGKANTR